MPGRPRKPTAVLELNGAYDKNPQRRAEREGEPDSGGPLGLPPSHMTPEQGALWGELADICPWAGKSDRWLVEQTVRVATYARYGAFDAQVERLLTTCLTKLGLTPADRSRVKWFGEQKPEANPFDELTA